MEYTSCRGKPKCLLGKLTTNVEVQGIPLDLLDQYLQDNNPNWYIVATKRQTPKRQFDLAVVVEGISLSDSACNLPISGSVARKITSYVRKANIPLESVYVTAMTKCAGPKGRRASIQESKTCSAHVYYELDQIKPKVVMLLGSQCLRLFNLHNSGGIYKNRGKLFKLKLPDWPDGPTFNVIPSFNPNMFIYRTHDPHAENRVHTDYIKAYNIIHGLGEGSSVKSKWHIINSVDKLHWLIQEIKKAKVCAFDTESRGLPWTKEPLICFSFSWGYDKNNNGNQSAVLPIYQHSPIPNSLNWYLTSFWGNHPARNISVKNVFKLLKDEIFENEEIPKAAHNLKYDMLVLRKWCGIHLKGRLYDTLLLSHILKEQKPHSLEYLSDVEFGCGDYSALLHNIVGRGKNLLKTYDQIPDHILWPYAAKDAENVYRLLCVYSARITDEVNHRNHKLWDLYNKRTEPLIRVLADAEWYGINIDQKKLKELKQDFEDRRDQLVVSLQGQTFPTFNPMSTKDVVKAITQAGFEHEIKDYSKPSGFSTSQEKLETLKSKIPFVNDIIKYRTLKKMSSTYIQRIEDDLDSDGKIRKSFLQHGTESGRLSCPLLHQIPRNDEQRGIYIRDVFIPSPEYEFSYMDYKQIELKVFGILVYQLTGDKKLMDEFLDPELDAHRRRAAMILELPEELINDYNRSLGKTLNFGIVYMSSGYDLSTQLYEDLYGNRHQVGWEMVRKSLNLFHKTYPGVQEYIDLVLEMTRQMGGVYTTTFGRDRHMGEVIYGDEKSDSKVRAAIRELVNSTVQGPASQITCDTNVLLHNEIKKWEQQGALKEGDVRIVNTVHDSIKLEYRTHLRDWVQKMVKELAERKIPELENTRFTIDYGYGMSWTEAENNSKVKK